MDSNPSTAYTSTGVGGGTRSLFPQGPSFTLDKFSSKDFIVQDFVEELAESFTPSNRRSGPGFQAFDPKPLIRTFENAMSQLESLLDELGGREAELLASVRRAETTHNQNLETLGRKLGQSIETFESLDISLNNPTTVTYNNRNEKNEGGNIAVQIGERLEDLDKQRRRALDANFLIKCWLEVSETGQITSLESMMQRQGSGENKMRCAVIARQLMKMSQTLDSSSWVQAERSNNTNGTVVEKNGNCGHNTREIIEKFSETLEKELLKQFDDSYRKKNYSEMLECAKVMHDFNGGSSIIALFVNQHQFFIDKNQLITEELTTDNEIWEKLADPDQDPPGVEPSLQYLINEIRIVMQNESYVIKRAFPYYELVLIKFIQRVFQQSIQQRLEMVLDKANSISSLAYLRSLHASRSYITNLIEDLKAHGLTEHPEPCSAQTSLSLDQQLDELFVPYLVGNSYIERERKSLIELISSLLFKYTIYHSGRKKIATGFMASLAQQGSQLLSSTKDAYKDGINSSELTPTQKEMMMKVADLRDTESIKNRNEIDVSDKDGLISISVSKRMLKWIAEGVRRALELDNSSETSRNVSVLLNLLLTGAGQIYIETFLDAIYEQATSQETSKMEPDLAYLPQLQPAITITSLISHFIKTVLLPLADTNTTVRRSMETQTKAALERIEEKTNNIIKSTLVVAINWVTKLLANQKKTDFKPKDTDLVETLQTVTCLSISTFLIKLSNLITQAIDGHNLEFFCSSLAVSIRDLIFEHFKKFQVNATGGLFVAQDMSKYVATLKSLPLTYDAAISVEVLGEIGNLFIIGPEALRERSRNLLQGVGGKRLTKADFRAFVMRRDDSGSVGVQSVITGL
ncbi:Exocyst complex component SEC10 [Golovinomyces cichoracearum]|uniref:Exocyst complex component SEC10 n=1 Tax=Golovinomyces cichoracearum TaxID=62708 RepID=A0A420HDN7_9PEZI|nr:Exocyst complex component SEC10 [Golovinomyces cichoracearum]